jgi:triosephosphate isomerase
MQKGSYTGQVSAKSLQEIGCSYCIVGHSEQRMLGTTSEEVAQQAAQLFSHDIQPIICIGETKIECEKNLVFIVTDELVNSRGCICPSASCTQGRFGRYFLDISFFCLGHR